MEDRKNDRTTPKIGVLIVIYNRRCDASVSVASIAATEKQVFIIADNSTDTDVAAFNRDFCLRSGIEYCEMNGNSGLSAAYNRGLLMLGNRADYLAILDDDTVIPENWMTSLQTAISLDPVAAVYVPYVYDTKGLLSPNRRIGPLFFRLHQKPSQFSDKMSAINSGMVIRIDSAEIASPLFDESLFLDCVDHLFVIRQREAGHTFCMYSADLTQTFFDASEQSRDELLPRAFSRFSGFVKDYLSFARACSLNGLLVRAYLVFRSLKLNLRFRTFRFFRAL
jgi:GT2 family glycosyltransferase